jgi:DnaK suppressor protein
MSEQRQDIQPWIGGGGTHPLSLLCVVWRTDNETVAIRRRIAISMAASDTDDAQGADLRALLLQKRAEIIARVDQLGERDPAEVANLGFGKRIGDATTYAVERMTDAYQARTIYATVAEIDQALERLDAGTYGYCVACSELIPEERLQAVPWAALCVPCSAKPRKSGVVR